MTTPERGRHRAPEATRAVLPVVSGVCALLCVPAVAALVLLLLRHAPDSTAHARRDALAAATKAAHDVLSYDYRTLDRDVARARSETTGAFAQQYAESSGKLLTQAKQLKAIVQASVGLPGVVSARSGTVVVLVFVDQASVKQLPGQKTPTTRIDQSRVRLTMSRVDGRWLVSALAAL